MASGEPAYALRLCEDTRPASGRCALGALNRVLYVRRGALAVGTDSREVAVTADHAWHGVHACEIVAGDTGSTVLRYELIRGAAPLGGVAGGAAAGVSSAPPRPPPRAGGSDWPRPPPLRPRPGGRAL